MLWSRWVRTKIRQIIDVRHFWVFENGRNSMEIFSCTFFNFLTFKPYESSVGDKCCYYLYLAHEGEERLAGGQLPLLPAVPDHRPHTPAHHQRTVRLLLTRELETEHCHTLRHFHLPLQSCAWNALPDLEGNRYLAGPGSHERSSRTVKGI